MSKLRIRLWSGLSPLIRAFMSSGASFFSLGLSSPCYFLTLVVKGLLRYSGSEKIALSCWVVLTTTSPTQSIRIPTPQVFHVSSWPPTNTLTHQEHQLFFCLIVEKSSKQTVRLLSKIMKFVTYQLFMGGSFHFF